MLTQGPGSIVTELYEVSHTSYIPIYCILLEGLVGGCHEVGEMAVRGEQQETLAVTVLSRWIQRPGLI